MNHKTVNVSKPSIVLTVDAHSYSINMVDVAVAIAASSKTHLHGLFIEDEDLLDVAKLPFTREISFATAREYPTDITRMQNSLRALGTQFKTALQRSAIASNVSWSYDYVRGRRDDIGLDGVPDVSFTIVGQNSLHRAETVLRKRMHRMLIINNHSPRLSQLLKVLLERFNHDPVEVTLLYDSKENLELMGKLVGEFMSPNSPITVNSNKLEDLETILAGRVQDFEYAIVPQLTEKALQRRLLHELDCPIILVA